MQKFISILIVDDDEDDYILTKDMFSDIKQIQFNIDWVRSYQEGIDAIIKNQHHVYLVDYLLGEKNGIDLTKEAIVLGCTAPIIILTGKGHQEIDLRAMQEGAADYLVKTEITSQLLERSIRYALNNSKIISEVNEKEKKYRSLFEKSMDAIYIADTEQHLLECNPSMIKLLGYDEDELLKLNLRELFLELNDYKMFSRKLINENQVKNFETRFKGRTGKELLVQITSVNLDFNGERYFQGIIHDLAMRKKAEQEILMAEKLSMTGKIARSIAHEVRNPLSSLNLALEQLYEELEELEDVDIYIDIIRNNARRIDQLISEMLKSSKPRELRLENHNINEILKESFDLIGDRLKLQGMRFEQFYKDDISLIPLDKAQIKTALTNIMINAVESMEPDHGILKVITNENQDEISVVIEDNGSGVSDQDINHLFEPFFTSKKSGMGLGLTSTRNIIHSHGGRIEVESKIDQGTRFHISFPKTR